MKNVVVIGGGIIGLSSAFYLRQCGHNVIVLDKDDFTDNCSYGNLGYVCVSKSFYSTRCAGHYLAGN